MLLFCKEGYSVQQLPKLERLDYQTIEVSSGVIQNVADPLRESPALRVLAEMVRADETMFAQVAAFTARRADFAKEYNRPGRNVAPWFAAIARNNPDLLDTALDAHFDDKSKTTHERLQTDAEEAGYSYWPSMVLGSGPQSQIFVSALGLERPELAKRTLVVDSAQTVGGTFRSSDGMNFRLNSRTRVQTNDDRPIPGTVSNLNTLAPGVMTLGDTTTDTYTSANDLGRTIRINHVLNNSDFGLGLSAERIIPDDPAQPAPLKGNVGVVLKDAFGNEYTVRTDTLTIASGIGKPDLERFTQETKAYIEEQQRVLEQGGKPKVILYQDLYKYLQDTKFPFKDIERVAVVGGGDSARTAIGTMLGYEPRQDDSVIQVDRVETVDWYGVGTDTDRRFIEATRLRYAQLALELPRSGAPRERVNRINAFEQKVTTITDKGDTDKPLISGNEYDLVVLTTGFTNGGDKWMLEKLAEPLNVTSTKVQNTLQSLDPANRLATGDVIKFPVGFSIERMQILRTFEQNETPMYTVCFQSADGTSTVGQLAGTKSDEYSSLADYCSLGNFVQDDSQTTAVTTANPEVEPQVDLVKPVTYTANTYLAKSQKDRLQILNSNAFIFLGDVELDEPLDPEYAYRIVRSTRSVTTLEAYDILPDGVSGLALRSLDDKNITIKTSALETILRDNDIYENALVVTDLITEVNDSNTVKYQPSEIGKILDATGPYLNRLADSNAVIAFGANFRQWALITRDDNNEIAVLLSIGDDGSWSFNSYNITTLINDLNDANREVSITANNINEIFTDAALEVLTAKSTGPYTVTSSADYNRLPLVKKTEVIQVGTVLSAGSAGNGVNSYIVTKADSDRNLVTLKPTTLRVLRGGRVALDVVSNSYTSSTIDTTYDGILGYGTDRGREVITNGLTAGITESGNSAVLRLTTDEIVNRLDEFYDAGAILIDSKQQGYLTYISLYKDSRGDQDVAFLNSLGFYGKDGLKINAEGLRRLAGQNNWDTVIIPNKNQPIGSTKITYTKRLPSRQIRTVKNEDGDTIAKQIDGLPVYFVGAAAGLPIAEDVTRLIPNIPDNSVGIFVSQPRVIQVAGRTAITSSRIRQKAERPTKTPEYTDDENAALMLTKLVMRTELGPTTMSTEREIPFVREAVALPKSALKLSAEELMKFGLGVRARTIGITGSISLLTDTYDIRLMYADPSQEALRMITTTNQAIMPEDDDLASLFVDNAHVLNAVNRILKQHGVSEIGLKLNFDTRGLQVDNIGLTIGRNKKPRRAPPMPIFKN